MEKYTEILCLREMLKESNVPFHIFRRLDGYQILYPNIHTPRCSIIQHEFSYGGKDNLIEIQGLLTIEERKSSSVLGYLDAKNVFERIKKDFNN